MVDKSTCQHHFEPRYDEYPVSMMMDWSAKDSVNYKATHKRIWVADVCTKCGDVRFVDRRA